MLSPPQMSDLALEANGDADLLGVRFRDKFTTHWANLHHPEGACVHMLRVCSAQLEQR